MKMWDKIKAFFAKLIPIFKAFLAAAFSAAEQALIAELKDFAVQAVTKLAASDLSTADKREAALKEIQAEALRRGKILKESLARTLVEIAVQFYKKNGGK